MKRVSIFTLSAALLLAACSPKVDTSSPQDYAASIMKMTEGMTDSQKADFRDAMLAVVFNGSESASGLMKSADLSSPIFLGAGDRIKGKTAPEIIKLGFETRIAALDSEIKAAVGEVQRIQEQRQKLKDVFDNIHVDGAKYYIDTSNMFMDQPIISFRITNNSKVALARIYVQGVLTSPGRSIPWVSDDFNYEFSGGLEPGESEQLNLEPNSFGEWKADERYSRRDDLKLALSLVNIEDASGNKLLEGDPGDAKGRQAEVVEKEKTRSELQKKLAAL